MSDGNMSEMPRSNAVATLKILVIALGGPGLGLVLWGSAIAFAPPWTFLTGVIYPPLACVGLPLVIVAPVALRRRAHEMLAFLALTVVAAVLMLIIVGTDLPTGMTDCQSLMASPPQARYACVSTSSDTKQRLEFTLEGWANWPVMRMVDVKHYR